MSTDTLKHCAIYINTMYIYKYMFVFRMRVCILYKIIGKCPLHYVNVYVFMCGCKFARPQTLSSFENYVASLASDFLACEISRTVWYNKYTHTGTGCMRIYMTIWEVEHVNSMLNIIPYGNDVRQFVLRVERSKREWSFAELARFLCTPSAVRILRRSVYAIELVFSIYYKNHWTNVTINTVRTHLTPMCKCFWFLIVDQKTTSEQDE